MAEILSELINCKSTCTVHVSYRSVKMFQGKKKEFTKLKSKKFGLKSKLSTLSSKDTAPCTR